MKPEETNTLFNKFTRLSNASQSHTEGTGLGLYVARQIINEHHGQVSAESKGLGQGSTFTMRLPSQNSPRSLKLTDNAEVIIKAAEAVGTQ
jgi:signal transduction histidine kinase